MNEQQQHPKAAAIRTEVNTLKKALGDKLSPEARESLDRLGALVHEGADPEAQVTGRPADELKANAGRFNQNR